MRAERTFGPADQLKYAALSGDFNPIHVDGVYARRSPLGLVVHGIHVVLWALEVFAKGHRAGFHTLKAMFLKPVLPGEKVAAVGQAEGGNWRINVSQNGSIVASILVTPAPVEARPRVEEAVGGMPSAPLHKEFVDLENEEGDLLVSGHDHDLKAAFPHLAETVGTRRIAALNGLSRLVGMTCPGLNSLFCGVEMIVTASFSSHLKYRVGRLRSPRAPIKIAVEGDGVQAELSVLYRPSPVVQPNFKELKRNVNPGEFSRLRVLVVGGSRGLGEVTAKLLAAGGAQVCMTYCQGEADARALQKEISAEGGEAELRRLDVLDLSPSDLGWLTERRFDQLYYFATPVIRANASRVFDHELRRAFGRFYVDAFAQLTDALQGNTCTVFYPSTVFLNERPEEYAEYVAAKEAGESLARSVNEKRGTVRVAIARLPRMNTDQTNTLLGAKAEEPAGILLKMIRAHMMTAEDEGAHDRK